MLMISAFLKVAFGTVFSGLGSFLTVLAVASMSLFGGYVYGRIDAYHIHKVDALKQQVFELEFSIAVNEHAQGISQKQAETHQGIETTNAEAQGTIDQEIAASPNSTGCFSDGFMRKLGTLR